MHWRLIEPNQESKIFCFLLQNINKPVFIIFAVRISALYSSLIEINQAVYHRSQTTVLWCLMVNGMLDKIPQICLTLFRTKQVFYNHLKFLYLLESVYTSNKIPTKQAVSLTAKQIVPPLNTKLWQLSILFVNISTAWIFCLILTMACLVFQNKQKLN